MEIAFKCTEGEFYEKYLQYQEEEQRFINLASEFLVRNDLTVNKYCVGSQLAVKFSDGEESKFGNQLKKAKTNGFSEFKVNSTINKKWKAEVWNQADGNLIQRMRQWWFWITPSPYLSMAGRFSCCLWEYKGVLYGTLEGEPRKGTEIQLPEFFQRIKMSEYYAVLEQSEEEEKHYG